MLIKETIQGVTLQFETDSSLFSPAAVDRGTLAMLSAAEFQPEDVVLDLGCGYGVVGILAAKKTDAERVTMCDCEEAAVVLSQQNAEKNGVPGITILQSNGFEKVMRQDFTVILSNPPYHTDFSVAKHFIEEGYRHLAEGGRMVMVTKRLDWYKNKLASVFGGVRVQETDGYFVFCAQKRGRPVKKEKPVRTMSKKLERRYAGKKKGVRK